ncbi:restriction endonuclease subunit S [Lactobacillus gasseri]|uniref:restriction endonuclease subunit S n=1 Tax=Lactobacillus gasseri TaxID=1596 RepID=UPI0022E2F462|nr:restriction endonuclease subunit S [Lactobacillus gasseri]
MTKSDDKRVPALRFKGFTDEWEQRKPGDFLFESKIIGHKGDKAKKLTVKLWGKGVQEKQDILSGSANTQYYIRKSGQLMYGKLDFLHAAFGIVPPQLNNYESTIDSPSFDVKSANSIFLLNLFLRKKFYLYYGERANGSRKAKRIHEKDFLVMPIKVPEINEQNKISSLIKIINNQITLQQRKENQIKLLKKAMLQTLFTNKNVPQLRFKGFTDNWEQRKLNSFLVEYKKKTKINNQYPVLTSSRQGIFFQKDYYDGNQIASKNNIGYNIVPRNYFTYRHMSDDTIFHFNINTLCDYGIVSTLYPVFTTSNQLSSSWLYYYLNYGNDMKKYALLQKQGGSRTYMYFSKLKNMLGHIPNVKEQDSISKILLKTDNLITLQQNKTKKIENLKQFLLQNMFI